MIISLCHYLGLAEKKKDSLTTALSPCLFSPSFSLLPTLLYFLSFLFLSFFKVSSRAIIPKPNREVCKNVFLRNRNRNFSKSSYLLFMNCVVLERSFNLSFLIFYKLRISPQGQVSNFVLFRILIL